MVPHRNSRHAAPRTVRGSDCLEPFTICEATWYKQATAPRAARKRVAGDRAARTSHYRRGSMGEGSIADCACGRAVRETRPSWAAASSLDKSVPDDWILEMWFVRSQPRDRHRRTKGAHPKYGPQNYRGACANGLKERSDWLKTDCFRSWQAVMRPEVDYALANSGSSCKASGGPDGPSWPHAQRAEQIQRTSEPGSDDRHLRAARRLRGINQRERN